MFIYQLNIEISYNILFNDVSQQKSCKLPSRAAKVAEEHILCEQQSYPSPCHRLSIQ
jgi:hypothetical protein